MFTLPFVGVRECVFAHILELQQQQENGGPNLLSAENKGCAVNGDPKAHVHKDLTANSLTSEVVQQWGGQTEPLQLDQ